MGLRITTNLLALGVQRNLANTTRAIARSLQRLSSGSRINTGRDDPAGLAMASGLEAQRRGLLQAVRNLNDSRGFLETADGALAEQTNIVQRMRELAVQASSGTLSNSARGFLNLEVQQLLSEFDRLATQTQFNGVNLLDGTFSTRAIQVGSKKGHSIDVNLTSSRSSAIFLTTTTTTTSATTSVGTGIFSARTTMSVPNGVSAAGALSTGDLNGDGFTDIVSSDYSLVSIFLSNGNGTFKARITQDGWGASKPIWMFDLNGDSKLDLIGPDSSGAVLIALGNGNGTFKAQTTITAAVNSNIVDAGDINGDAKMDLVIKDGNDGTVSLFLGNGNGTFLARSTIKAGTFSLDLYLRDMNGDGNLDIIETDHDAGEISTFLGNGNGTFAVRKTIFESQLHNSFVIGDVNGDSKLDIVFQDSGGQGWVQMGNGNGTYQNKTATGVAGLIVKALDLNGDGKIDLFTHDQNNLASISYGNGNGTFNAATTYRTGTYPVYDTSIATGDFNGDGVIDLATADGTDKTISVLMQSTTGGSSSSSSTSTSLADVRISTQTLAENLLSVLDSALATLNSARSNIGALQSRLDFATSVNMNTIENISAAQSQIMDTDMAAETAEFARLQILQKAGIAVLGQANANAKLSLRLLENL